MTLDEAQRVADVLSTADNGCPACVAALCRVMNGAFPDFHFIAQAEYADDRHFSPIVVNPVRHEP